MQNVSDETLNQRNRAFFLFDRLTHALRVITDAVLLFYRFF